MGSDGTLPDAPMQRREALRTSVWMKEAPQLAHDLATPLNVLLGRLALLEDDPSESVQAHLPSMRRQLERLQSILERLRGTLPQREVPSMPVSEIAKCVAGELRVEVEVTADGEGALGMPELLEPCVRAMADHLGSVRTARVAAREVASPPVRYAAPGSFVTVELWSPPTAEAGSASWALPCAEGLARRMGGFVFASASTATEDPSMVLGLVGVQPSRASS